VSRIIRSFIVAALLGPLTVQAQTPPAESAPAAPAPVLGSDPGKGPPWYSAVTFSGMIDAYYMIRFDAAQDAPIRARVFDPAIDPNSGAPNGGAGFNLGYAKLSAFMAPSPVGFRLDLGFGPAANVLSPDLGLTRDINNPAKYVQQAYAAMQLGPVELDVGRFATSAGAEVIEAKDNWLYSRSLLFGLVPFTHVGAKASATVLPGLTATLGVNNGWDVLVGGAAGRTAQVSLAWAGPRATTLAANLYVGENPFLWSGATNTGGSIRTLVDAVAATTYGPFSFNVNFDWATEAGNDWWGISGMVRYALPGDFLRVTGRGEFVKDYHGARFFTPAGAQVGLDTEVFEFTGGLSVPVGSHAELRLEGRYDHADNDAIFVGSKNLEPKKDQATGTLAALVWF